MGKAIAKHFGFRYIDKEILVKAAEVMNMTEENLEYVDEKNTAIWTTLAPVSYTHLDVYKRQNSARSSSVIFWS